MSNNMFSFFSCYPFPVILSASAEDGQAKDLCLHNIPQAEILRPPVCIKTTNSPIRNENPRSIVFNV